jgi:hypothetical protein
MRGWWIDESASIDPVTVATTLAGKALAQSGLLPKVVDSIDVPCRSCGVEAGQRCSARFKGHTYSPRKPHYCRKKDAAAATEAVRALI